MTTGSIPRFFVFAVWVGILLPGGKAEAQMSRTFTKTVDIETTGTVTLNVVKGSARVTTWDRPAVEVRAQVDGKNAAQIKKAQLQVEEASREVTIRMQETGGGEGGLLALLGLGESDGPDTHYRIRMPVTADLSLTTESASVEVRGVAGDGTIEGASSPIHLRNVTGDATIATFSGSLDADSLRGDLIFATFSGDATVRRQALDGDHQLATFSGNADITLPADAAFDLQTDITWGGSVTSDFAAPDSSAQGEGPLPIGGGGPTLAFESFSGSLTLRAE